MARTVARSGRLGLACDARKHVDGDHECASRFWPMRDRFVRPERPDAWWNEIARRARNRGWHVEGETHLCPYHAHPAPWTGQVPPEVR